ISLVEGFAVQKWMKSRGWKREVVANEDDDGRWADLQLIFNHLDTKQTGKISLYAIRNALNMVKLSEDPARHTYLSERIASCFHPSGLSKSTGGAVDLTQFADAMTVKEQGRKFQSLQDELRNQGMAVAKTHFANIFRREAVLRGLLDSGGTITYMCSVFQKLFKAGGLAASASDRVQKLRLMEEAIEQRKKRALERKRTVQAKQTLLELRSRLLKRGNTSRYRARFAFSVKMTPIPPPSGDVSRQYGGVAASVSRIVSQEDGVTLQQSKGDPADAKKTAVECVTRRARRSRGQSGLLQQDGTSIGFRLKKEAAREAAAVLGAQYVPTPPSRTITNNPAATQALAHASGRRGLWRSIGISSSSSASCCSAFPANDRLRTKRVMTSDLPGGFVRWPPASVRRLRRRRQQQPPSPAERQPHEERRGKRAIASRSVAASDLDDPDDLEGKSRRRKDAILKRTPRCRRSTIATLPSWASCENSACDHGQARNTARKVSASKKSADDDRRAMEESHARCAAGVATGQKVLSRQSRAAEAAAATAAEATSLWENERWQERGGQFGSHDTSILSATTLSPSVTTVVTAVVPTAMTHEHSLAGNEQRSISSSSNTSNSSNLATERDPIHLGEGDAAECFHLAARIVTEQPPHVLDPPADKGKEALRQALARSPRKPQSSMGKARSGRRQAIGNDYIRGRGGGGGRGGPEGGNEHAAATAANKWQLSPTPWRTPRVVRCMRRPEPGRGVAGIAIQQ
ncbi:unnamed protein product, partial [Pylaiella littoralis]